MRIVDKQYKDITDRDAGPKPGDNVTISDDVWCCYHGGVCTRRADGKLVIEDGSRDEVYYEVYYDEKRGRWEAKRLD